MQNKIIYFIYLFFIILTGIVISSCSIFTYSENKIPKIEEPKISNSINTDDIAVIKEFAENYEPKSPDKEVIPSPPWLNSRDLQAISNFSNNQSQQHEKYVMLIFLRLYRFHLEHFKQSYELGRENPLTKEFFRLIKSNNYEKVELMPSYLVHNYVKENSELLKYDLITKELTRIEKIEKNSN